MPCRRPQTRFIRGAVAARRSRGAARAGALAAALSLSASCWEAAVGIPPPPDALAFPSGLSLDPRVDEGEPSRWLFVVNANSDLVLNASSVVAVDLDAFHRRWQNPASGLARADIPSPHFEVTAERPCRRNAERPQLVECLEEPFVLGDQTIYLTSFATVLRGYRRHDASKARLFTPVRGDPSVSYVNISGGLDGGDVKLDCGQGWDPDDPRRCDNAFRLQHLFDDSDQQRIPLEPANLLISSSPWRDDVVIVTHYNLPQLTLIELEDGGEERTPQIVDIASPFVEVGSGTYGLAEWPCQDGRAPSFTRRDHQRCVDTRCDCAAGECLCDADVDPTCRSITPCGVETIECAVSEPLSGACVVPDSGACPPDEDAACEALGQRCAVSPGVAPECIDPACQVDDDCVVPGVRCELAGVCQLPDDPECAQACGAGEACVPASACGRPLLYAGARNAQGALAFTTERLSALEEEHGNPQTCVDAEGLGTPGGITCNMQILTDSLFSTGGFDIGESTSAAVGGEMAFSESGDYLYVVQTNPGGLIRVDTSLDDTGRPKNLPAGVVEVCAEPNAIALFSDETGEYAAVTCHRPALVFIVELKGFRVVANILASTGPHELVYDKPRGFLYVANSLDATISVIDVDNTRTTRFTEVARLGLEEPYSS